MTLAITYDELRRDIGRFIGASRSTSAIEGNTTWNTDVEDILVKGLRQFYYPPQGYVWSFLYRDLVVSTQSSVSSYDLPEDFSGLQGSFTYSVGVDQAPLSIIGEEELRRLQARASASGPPKFAAVRARSTHERTRYEVLVYPTPDAAYTLTARYIIEPDILSDDNPYPLGGAQHSEVILESCLAAAEKTLDPESGPALHAQEFAKLLAAHIERDRQLLQGAADEHAWPADAVEGTSDGLSINRTYLERRIGKLLGYGPNPAAWTYNQQAEITEALRCGLRKFYDPMVPEGAYQWKFLSPVLRVQLQSGKTTQDLPDGFAMLNGAITFAADDFSLGTELELTGEERVRRNLQGDNSTARPRLIAVRPKPDIEGTTYELIVWPIPDDSYQLDVPCKINPDLITGDKSLLPGGQAHAQTIIEACLAAAEELHPDVGQQHRELFAERLHVSVSHDKQASCPDTYGYMGDPGHGYYFHGVGWRAYDGHLTAYNGVVY